MSESNVDEVARRFRNEALIDKDAVKKWLLDHRFADLATFVATGKGDHVTAALAWLDERNASRLHQEPERDQFKSESPIRAFTSWDVMGKYALGKGFRPSLHHMIPYLHAMEEKEGWSVVQVLEASSQTPSFLFRQSRVIADDVLIGRMTEDPVLIAELKRLLGEEPYIRNEAGFKEAGEKIAQAEALSAEMDHGDRELYADVMERYVIEATELRRKIACGLRQVADEMECYFRGDSLNLRYDDWLPVKNKAMTFVDRIRGYAAELEPSHVLAYTSGRLTRHELAPAIPEGVYWCDSNGTFYDTETHALKGIEFYKEWVGRRDAFPGDPREVTSEFIGKAHKPGCSSLPKGERPCNCGGNPNFIDAEKEKEANRIAERDGIKRSPELDAAINNAVFSVHIADDPINPKHYGGTGCAEIIENMPGNCAHAVTYLWRAGDKPDQPEAQEIGKALWFLKRELPLAKAYEECEDDPLLTDQDSFMTWRMPTPKAKKKGAPVPPSRFYAYALQRVTAANLSLYRHEAIMNLVRYCTSRDSLHLESAMEICEQRIACLNTEEGCGEFGRQQEP